MKIFRIFLATLLALSLMGLPVMATESVNLIPGGSFAEEAFEEDVSINNYNSGEAFNNGTWTATFTYDEVANDSGYVLVRKLNAGGNQVELRRGGSGYGYMYSKAFALTRGETYTFSYKFRCTSGSGTDASVTIEEYSDASCAEVVTNHEMYKNTIGNTMTAFSSELTIPEGTGTEAYVRIRFNIGNTRRALQIQDISLTLGKPVDVGGDDEEEEENLGNLLPGGAFESEIFAEDVTVNEYNSEEKINNGTWTCAFTYNETQNDSGWCKVKKQNDGKHTVEIRRGLSGVASLSTNKIPVKLGKTYKISYDIRCTSSSGMYYTLNMPAFEDELQITTHTLYTSPSTSDPNVLKNTFKHMEHYFTVPDGRRGITDITISFSIGSTRRALEIRNISLTYCGDTFTGFTAASTVEQDVYNSKQWCKNDSYDSLNVHTIVSTPYITSSMVAGNEVTLYPVTTDQGVEGEAAQTAIFAQYSEAGTLLSIDFLTTQTAKVEERDVLRSVVPKKVTLHADATNYKVFFRGGLTSMIPLKDVTGGTITAQAEAA